MEPNPTNLPEPHKPQFQVPGRDSRPSEGTPTDSKREADRIAEEAAKAAVRSSLGEEQDDPDDDTDDAADDPKKPVAPAKKTPDNEGEGKGSKPKGEDTEPVTEEALLQGIIETEYGGDQSKKAEAEAVLNLLLDTFQGDAVKAAKSYRSTAQEYSKLQAQLHNLKNHPQIGKAVAAVLENKPVESPEPVGGPTGANSKPGAEKPVGSQETDFRSLHKTTPEVLIESGFIDKAEYEASTAVQKESMVQIARVAYAATKSTEIAELQRQEREKQTQVEGAQRTNTERVQKSIQEMSVRYSNFNIQDPAQAALVEEITKVATKFPDLDDESGLLIASDAWERATAHVYKKHGIELKPVAAPAPPAKGGKDTAPDTHSSARMAALQRLVHGSPNLHTNNAPPAARKSGPKDITDKVQDRMAQIIERQQKANDMINIQRGGR